MRLPGHSFRKWDGVNFTVADDKRVREMKHGPNIFLCHPFARKLRGLFFFFHYRYLSMFLN